MRGWATILNQKVGNIRVTPTLVTPSSFNTLTPLYNLDNLLPPLGLLLPVHFLEPIPKKAL